ncbi:hypothetical protein Cni_G05971 [Canna indica]|uniref:Chloroplast protein HCF243 n=1 Tax=Canna indica TaxID=4628 RepID=A0AAQ3JW30_9LILI|nr:hypothetical protein Cni_G05971 [Canna indica]
MRLKKNTSLGGARRGDLFLCFTSRRSASATPSSSAAAMRVPSTKSLPSPGRNRDPAATAAAPSLSSSLSRRLRNSGSVKGGQSPMFPAIVGGRRKGVAFEAAEPTSPKVTCIGQVRVKSKRKKAAAAAAKSRASMMRSRSVRGSGREASFRRMEDVGGGRECLPSRNRKWAHQLPVNICEALRALGSDFNCFSPCGGRSSCLSSSRSVERKGEECEEKRSSSCGAVFARWLMAVPDCEEGKRREAISVVVEDRRDRDMRMVVEERVKKEDLSFGVEMEKGEEVVMVVEKAEEKEEDEARVSICIPPRNALLLMRCRSDPVRMAALTSRFWDSPAMHVRVEKEGVEEEDDLDVNLDQCAESNVKLEGEERSKESTETKQVYQEEVGAEESLQASVLTEDLKAASDGIEDKEEEVRLSRDEEMQNKAADLKGAAVDHVDEDANSGSDQEVREVAAASAENSHSGEKTEEADIPNETYLQDREGEKEVDKGRRSSSCTSTIDTQERTNRHISRSKEGGKIRERDRRHSFSTERDVRRPSIGSEKEVRRASFSMEGKGRWSFSVEKDGLRLEKEEIDDQKSSKEQCWAEKEPKDDIKVQDSHSTDRGGEKEDIQDREHCQVEQEAAQTTVDGKSKELPDCLLLMMYEPKLSMEVSRETWVCSTDFLRWQHHHPNYRPFHPSKSVGAANTTTTATVDTHGTSLDEETGDKESKITNNESGENKVVVVPKQELSLPSPPLPSVPPTSSDTEKKLKTNAADVPTPMSAPAYGPFVLTRCKSEPMRSSVRLTPDACFWKDRHRPIGATGIGF